MNRLTTLMLERVSAWVCGRELWGMALDMVMIYERKEMSGAEKRARILAAMYTEFEVMGKDLASSLAGFAVESALQYIRRRRSV